MTRKTKLHANRTYKSTVFIMLFEDKKNLLELYNAMTGKEYQDPEQLEINTLENAIYMHMNNDVSFIIDGRLSLYEHQSTYNPNMPLRFLYYLSELYSGISKDKNIYGTTRIQLPTPNFIVFYNGKEEIPERQVLKLSDLYAVKEERQMLELEAVMLNISGKNNEMLKETCKVLKEYAIYTDLIRGYIQEGMTIDEAVEMAITECIRNGVLKEFLEKNKAEAFSMSIYEYDEKKHLQMEREEGIEIGEKKGIEKTLLELVKDEMITVEYAAEKLAMSVEELKKKLEE